MNGTRRIIILGIHIYQPGRSLFSFSQADTLSKTCRQYVVKPPKLYLIEKFAP